MAGGKKYSDGARVQPLWTNVVESDPKVLKPRQSTITLWTELPRAGFVCGVSLVFLLKFGLGFTSYFQYYSDMNFNLNFRVESTCFSDMPIVSR